MSRLIGKKVTSRSQLPDCRLPSLAAISAYQHVDIRVLRKSKISFLQSRISFAGVVGRYWIACIGILRSWGACGGCRTRLRAGNRKAHWNLQEHRLCLASSGHSCSGRSGCAYRVRRHRRSGPMAPGPFLQGLEAPQRSGHEQAGTHIAAQPHRLPPPLSRVPQTAFVVAQDRSGTARAGVVLHEERLRDVLSRMMAETADPCAFKDYASLPARCTISATG